MRRWFGAVRTAGGQHCSAGLYKPAAELSQPHRGVTRRGAAVRSRLRGRAALPSRRWLSALSSSAAASFPPARPGALSAFSYQMSPNRGANGGGSGGARSPVSAVAAPAPGDLEAQVPSALCRRKQGPFPHLLDPAGGQRAACAGQGLLRPRGQPGVGRRPEHPPARPSRGLARQAPLCTPMGVASLQEPGSPTARPWPGGPLQGPTRGGGTRCSQTPFAAAPMRCVINT